MLSTIKRFLFSSKVPGLYVNTDNREGKIRGIIRTPKRRKYMRLFSSPDPGTPSNKRVSWGSAVHG